MYVPAAAGSRADAAAIDFSFVQKKRELLARLLEGYNDGRKKTLFCLAVNLLELEDLESIVLELDQNARDLPVKERAACAAVLLQKAAQKRNVELKLRRKK